MIRVFAPALIVVLASACASTDEEPLFDTYSEPVQQMIRRNEIDLTFTKDQVRMSWGKPDEVRMEGKDEEWIYTKMVFRNFKRDKDPEVYKKERLIFEGKRAAGERVVEPQPTETVDQYRKKIWRVAIFRDDLVTASREPTEEYVGDWVTSEVR